jgi:hypothetical protein
VAEAGFPQATVFFDGAEYWLADGFHRIIAAKSLGLTEIGADVRAGTRRDAILYAVGANSAHGLKRTNRDKRNAAMTLLRDPEWAQWSNVEIGTRCNVSTMTVSNIGGRKRRIEPAGYDLPKKNDGPRFDEPVTDRFAPEIPDDLAVNLKNGEGEQIGQAPGATHEAIEVLFGKILMSVTSFLPGKPSPRIVVRLTSNSC